MKVLIVFAHNEPQAFNAASLVQRKRRASTSSDTGWPQHGHSQRWRQ